MNYTNFQDYQPWQRVEWTDVDGDNDATRNLVGEGIAAFTGIDQGLPTLGIDVAPLSIATSLTDLTLTVGGVGQSVFVQQRYADYCPATVLTIPPNTSGSVRFDIIAIAYNQIQINPHSAVFNYPSGGIETGTVYQIAESISLQYVTGTSGGYPSPPAGYVTFARVVIQTGATTSSQAAITVLFEPLTSGFSGAAGHGATTLAADFYPAPSGSTASAVFVDAAAFPVGIACQIANGTLTPFEGQITARSGNDVTIETFQGAAVKPDPRGLSRNIRRRSGSARHTGNRRGPALRVAGR